MDALFATFTGQTASTATGTSPAVAEDTSVFDGLLAAAGIAPIAPVPPVVPRHLEGRSGTAPQSLIANSTVPASGQGAPAAAPGDAPGIAAQAATASQPAVGQSASDGIAANGPIAGQPENAGSGPEANGASTSGTASATPQSVASATGGQDANSGNSAQITTPVAASTTGKSPEVSSAGGDDRAATKAAASALPGEKAAITQNTVAYNNVAVPAQPHEALGTASTVYNSRQAAAGGASSDPVAAARASANALASSPSSQAAALVQPQAGVQARREADGQIAGQSGKSAAKPASMANAAQPAQPPQSAQTAPPAQGAGTPPAATGPDLNAALPRSGGAVQMAQAPQGDRAAPPPVTIESGNPAPEGESEAADMAQMRSADASRAAERPGTAAGTARFTPANAGTLAAQIASRFQNGERRFEIRMDPPELGRVEVKMHVGNDNRVHAVLSADRPETLQDMRQHIRELERALAEAGLDLSEDGLSFELSQDRDDTHEQSPSSGGFSELAFAESASGDVVAAALPQELYGFRLARSGGVDVRL